MSLPTDQPEAKPCPHCKEAPLSMSQGEAQTFFRCGSCSCIWHSKADWNSRPIEDELRAKLMHDESLLAKGAEAMGFIRFAAGFYGLAGDSWSEEPGFAEAMTTAMLRSTKETRELRAELQRIKEENITILSGISHERHGVSGLCCQLRIQELERGNTLQSQLASAQKEIERLREESDDRAARIEAIHERQLSSLQSELAATEAERDKAVQQLEIVEENLPNDFEGSDDTPGRVVGIIVAERDSLRDEVEKLQAAARALKQED